MSWCFFSSFFFKCLTNLLREARQLFSMYVCLGAGAGRWRPLLTPRALDEAVSNRLPPTLRFFLGAGQSIESHSLTSNVSSKNTKLYPTDDKKGSNSQSSRKNNRSESGFFNPRSRLHNNWPDFWISFCVFHYTPVSHQKKNTRARKGVTCLHTITIRRSAYTLFVIRLGQAYSFHRVWWCHCPRFFRHSAYKKTRKKSRAPCNTQESTPPQLVQIMIYLIYLSMYSRWSSSSSAVVKGCAGSV